MTTIIKNVLLLGADGTLGAYLLPQLLQGPFNVTVLKRTGSKSPDSYPSTVTIKKIDDSFPEDELLSILESQDAVVLSIKGSQVDLQKKIADACVKTNHSIRLIPADFGSCDSSTAKAQQLVPLFKNKTELREYLQTLAEKHSHFTWTALVTGHLFDWLEFVKIEPEEKKISIIDDGSIKASYSTRDRVGEATRKVLELPDKTANKVLFVQSFLVDQNAIAAACEKATGSQWHREKVESVEFEKAWVRKRDQGVVAAIDNLVWLEGVRDGNWPQKSGFAMGTLQLKDQDLEEVVTSLLK